MHAAILPMVPGEIGDNPDPSPEAMNLARDVFNERGVLI
jgi:hypothetical protein